MRLLLCLFASAFATGVVLAGPSPLTAKEISLMLRSGYSNQSVLRELSSRGFAGEFDSDAQTQLARVGAGPDLIEALKSGRYRVAAAAMPATTQPNASVPSTQALPDNSNAAQTAPPKQAAPTPADVHDSIYSRIKGDLVQLHQGSVVPFDDDVLENKKFYLLFFGASWNSGARKFTPQLVDFYNRMAPEHPEFEVVFFSADRSQYAMETYLTQAAMPWPAVAYDKLSGKAGDFQHALVKEIPELVFADAAGKILSLSRTSGDNPVSLDQVLADAERVLTHGSQAAR